MREKKEEIIGASCLVIFNILNRLNRQKIGLHAEKAISQALAVIPRIPGEVLSRIDSDATSIIVDALTEAEAYVNSAVLALEAEIYVSGDEVDLEDEGAAGQFMFLERLSNECQRALKATGRRLVESETYRLWVPLDIWVVAVDETECWHLKDEDMAQCERIDGLYLFDKNETRKYGDKSCYYLLGIHNRPVFKEDVSDDERNRIGILVEEKGEISDNYFPVKTLDKDIKRIGDDEFCCYHLGNPSFDLAVAGDDNDDAKTEIMNIIRSWCCQTDILI